MYCQRGHFKYSWDSHGWCIACRSKGVGTDPCARDLDCVICKGFSKEQWHIFATRRSHRSRAARSSSVGTASTSLLDPQGSPHSPGRSRSEAGRVLGTVHGETLTTSSAGLSHPKLSSSMGEAVGVIPMTVAGVTKVRGALPNTPSFARPNIAWSNSARSVESGTRVDLRPYGQPGQVPPYQVEASGVPGPGHTQAQPGTARHSQAQAKPGTARHDQAKPGKPGSFHLTRSKLVVSRDPGTPRHSQAQPGTARQARVQSH